MAVPERVAGAFSERLAPAMYPFIDPSARDLRYTIPYHGPRWCV